MADCLFCKIAGGTVPADIVRQDDRYVAFRDINPQAPVHALAIPRQHISSLAAAEDPEVIGGLLMFARDVAREAGIEDAGYRVVLNVNEEGGQTVYHIHAHVLGGRAMRWPPG
jgi:histidine triad (HIT) family protein